MRSLAVSSALLLAAAGAASGAQWKETRYFTDSTCASNYGFQNDNMARRILANYWRVESCEPADCALVGQYTYSKTSCSASPPSPALGSGVGTLAVFANSDTNCRSAAQNTYTIPTKYVASGERRPRPICMTIERSLRSGVCKNNTDTSTRTSCNTENYSVRASTPFHAANPHETRPARTLPTGALRVRI